jgi:hypothetical protein
MKFLTLLFLLTTVGHYSFGQDKTLLQQSKYFDKELKKWTKTFSNFNLSDFKIKDTLRFENNYKQDFNTYKQFISIYKPIITYSSDSSKFIDIYSYQLNLEKNGDHYEANTEVDQAVLLCNPKTKYWNRIYFGGYSRWIDEVLWIAPTKFLLVGIIKSVDDKTNPHILLGDTDKQTLIEYVNTNKTSLQDDKGYMSSKLKKIKIEDL